MSVLVTAFYAANLMYVLQISTSDDKTTAAMVGTPVDN
jgi:hypothetical protein